ncbi:MAG: hypothetical protein ACI90V_007317 [Bacillariaceae sp.]|jgi:hypothetical protein
MYATDNYDLEAFHYNVFIISWWGVCFERKYRVSVQHTIKGDISKASD